MNQYQSTFTCRVLVHEFETHLKQFNQVLFFSCICLLNFIGFYTDIFYILELAEYNDVADEYGKPLTFQITTDTYYPAHWQRVSGDPHGQAAEEEKPDPLGDETLSFDFPDTGTHDLVLWEDPGYG